MNLCQLNIHFELNTIEWEQNGILFFLLILGIYLDKWIGVKPQFKLGFFALFGV